MQRRIAHSLASGLAAAMLATGAGVAAAGSASAAPSSTVRVTSTHMAQTTKKCHKVKGYWRTIKSHGKTKRVWVKPHTVCTKK